MPADTGRKDECLMVGIRSLFRGISKDVHESKCGLVQYKGEDITDGQCPSC